MIQRVPLAQYMAMTKDRSLRIQSTSGGVFTELARVVLREGGVVFGAVWDGRFRVVHKWTESEVGLEEMRGSKYAVSDMSGVYEPLRRFLSEGRKVLFTGTPCQTAAIRKVFGEKPNLILCALICMANIEAERWEKYARGLERSAKSKINKIYHRFKIDGQKGAFFKVEFKDESKNFVESLYNNRHWQDLRAKPRRVCLACQFRKGGHGADLQIGDFWGAEKLFPKIDIAKGISAVLAYSERGQDLLTRSGLMLVSVKYEQILAGNPYLERQYILHGKKSIAVRFMLWVKKRVHLTFKAKGGCFA